MENNINLLLQNSKYKILNFNLELKKLYKIIFKYCSEHNVILSNYNINISKILNKNYKLYNNSLDFKFNIFSTNPKKIAIELANILYLHYSKYIVVNIFLNNKEINISIDNKRIISINLLFIYDLKLQKSNFKFDNININIDSNVFNIKYTNDLLELLFISHKLYSPKYFLEYINDDLILYNNNYTKDINNINNIYNLLIDNIIELNKNQNIYINKYNKSGIDILKQNIINYILDNIDIQIVLLDSYAIQFINSKYGLKKNNFDNYINSLHISLYSKYNQIILNLIKEYLKNNKLIEQYKIEEKKSNFYIYNDFRFYKININLIKLDTNKKINIVNIYNNVNYEIVPIIFDKKNILIPHPIVIIKFIILNIINLQLFDKFYNNNKYSNNVNKIQLLKDISFNKDIYTFIYYYGVYIDERIDKFKFKNDIYRPWQYSIKNNKLLEIN